MYMALGRATFIFFLCIGAAFIGLTLYDYYARYTSGDARDDKNYQRAIYFSTTYFDESSGTNHMIGPQHLRGPSSSEWIQYDDGYDVKSGKFGFFTDWPVDDYPPKKENEFRIVLIGGSGAQGNGGRVNDEMLYKVLERKLGERLAGANIRIHVVNLAMAGAHATTNREILHAYGHRLKPDMILAYNGVNDTSQVMVEGFFQNNRDSGYGGPDLSYPWWMDWIVELYPTTMLKHGVAPRLAQFLGVHGQRKPLGTHLRNHAGDRAKSQPTGFYTSEVVPAIIKSFKAMKREFCGIPIVFVRQIWGEPEWSNAFLKRVYSVEVDAPYDYMWQNVQVGLRDYLNDKWMFLDAHNDIWARVKPRNLNYDDSRTEEYDLLWDDGKTYHMTEKSLHVHLDSNGHYLLSDWLAPRIAPMIEREYAASRADPCEINFRK